MSNMLQSGAAWLGEQLKPVGGRTVAIRQGSRVLTGIVATPVEQVYEITDDEGQPTSVVMTDWTIVAADLGGLALREGCELHETLHGEPTVWEAMPVGKLEAVHNFDTSGVLLTVHTKQIQ